VGFEVSGSYLGSSLSYFINNVDASNLINGKIIYYFMNKTNLLITSSNCPEIGYLILVNCNGTTIQNNDFQTQGILLGYCSDCMIKKQQLYRHSGQWSEPCLLLKLHSEK